MKLNIPFHDEVCEFTKIKQKPPTLAETRVTNQFGQIINKFRMLHHGWEMDEYGYVVDDGTKCKLVITDHLKPIESNVDYLRCKIQEYKQIIKETEDVIELVQNGKHKI